MYIYIYICIYIYIYTCIYIYIYYIFDILTWGNSGFVSTPNDNNCRNKSDKDNLDLKHNFLFSYQAQFMFKV